MIKGRALVTGACGFVGSHLTRRLVQNGLDVHILRRQQSDVGRIGDLLAHVSVHEVDLRDATALASSVRAARPDYVFHLAAASVVGGAAKPARDLIEGNLLATVNLIAACESIEYRGMVTTGDAFEYAPSFDRLSEANTCVPIDLHGVTRLAATLHAQNMARDGRRPILTLRLFSTYGPGDHSQRLLMRVIVDALAHADLRLSRPEVVRDWVYVEDVVDLYLQAASVASELTGGIYNVGRGEACSIRELVETVLKLTRSRSKPRWGTFAAAPYDDYPWVADPALTFATFPWRPKVALETGVLRTIASVVDGLPR